MLEDDVFGADFLAVEFFVGVVVGAQRGTFERDACEESARAGVGKNFRAQGNVRFRGGRAADR